MELENSHKLTAEETAELYTIRAATLNELVILAGKCGFTPRVEHYRDGRGVVYLEELSNYTIWDPANILSQSQLLLSAVIAEGDCRLFYDQEVNEFFIYQYTDNDSPALAHQHVLIDTVFEAALNLWFSEEE